MATTYSASGASSASVEFVPSCRTIVRQLLTLAADPENQQFIVQEEGCVAGLVGYLKNRDEDVVCMAAQALQFVTSNPATRQSMLGFQELLPNLASLTTSSNPKIREFSSACLSNLNATLDPTSPAGQQTSSELSPRSQNAPRYTVKDAAMGKAQPKKPNNATMKTFCIEVEGISDSFVRAAVERCLISQNGVISVTLDQARSQAIVGAKPSKRVQELVAALQNIGIAACPWGAKARKPLAPNAEHNGVDDDSGYLDDVDCFAQFGENGTITTNGFMSMEARLNAAESETDSDEDSSDEEDDSRAQRVAGKLGAVATAVTSWFW